MEKRETVVLMLGALLIIFVVSALHIGTLYFDEKDCMMLAKEPNTCGVIYHEGECIVCFINYADRNTVMITRDFYNAIKDNDVRCYGNFGNVTCIG